MFPNPYTTGKLKDVHYEQEKTQKIISSSGAELLKQVPDENREELSRAMLESKKSFLGNFFDFLANYKIYVNLFGVAIAAYFIYTFGLTGYLDIIAYGSASEHIWASVVTDIYIILAVIINQRF